MQGHIGKGSPAFGSVTSWEKRSTYMDLRRSRARSWIAAAAVASRSQALLLLFVRPEYHEASAQGQTEKK